MSWLGKCSYIKVDIEIVKAKIMDKKVHSIYVQSSSFWEVCILRFVRWDQKRSLFLLRAVGSLPVHYFSGWEFKSRIGSESYFERTNLFGAFLILPSLPFAYCMGWL